MTVKGTARTTNLASDPVYKTATPGTKKQMRRDHKTARAKALLVEKAAASAASELAAEKKKRESLAVEPVVSPVVQTVVVMGSHSDEGPEPDDEPFSFNDDELRSEQQSEPESPAPPQPRAPPPLASAARPAPPQPRPSEVLAALGCVCLIDDDQISRRYDYRNVKLTQMRWRTRDLRTSATVLPVVELSSSPVLIAVVSG